MLLQRRHLPQVSEAASHLSVDLGPLRLRWERHTEFHTATFVKPLSEMPGGFDRIALTDSGLIQVKGRINAAGSVNLMGGQVAVDGGAQVLAGPQAVAAFADLVNIDGVAPAAGGPVMPLRPPLTAWPW